MSLKTRRRSLALLLHQPAHEAPSIPFPPAVENISVGQPSTLNSTRSLGRSDSGPGRIIRRVSNIFAGRRKKQPPVAVAVLDQPGSSSQWKIINETSPTDTDVSIDDIRRPSGLGRAASISSHRSMPPSPFTAIDEESPFHRATNPGHERMRVMSSPNPLRSLEAQNKAKPLSRSPSAARRKKDDRPHTLPLPPEVLIVILSFIPRQCVASLATTSRNFYAAAKVAMYETLDLRTLQPHQVEKLVTLLAYRHDLTDIVRTFECHTWPVFFPPQSKHNGVHAHLSSFSPALTATFTIAFQNMHQVTSLVLPSFDHTFLRHHSAFGLKDLTFLNRAMSASETTQLFAWLDGQTNITHLAFPNLVDPSDTPASTSLNIPKGSQFASNTLTDSLNTHGVATPDITPAASPSSPFVFLPPPPPKSPFNSPALLPALTTLVATPSIITSLITTDSSALLRPLQNVTLSINNTLYTGLRPAALLNTLHGITTLVLKFGPAVDKRTIGKVLSAGAALSSKDRDQDTTASGKTLQTLGIEVSDTGEGADQALYKTIASALPRYQGLVEVWTRFSPDQTLVSETIEPSTPPALSDREIEHVNAWAKHCPSLQAVRMLSGASWKRPE
ncbi:hypothetical protein LshimejAT787_1202900 [Lyophyllum shimeji]|uniref:F-box domain-containing protein n=1 Tax=Lyophyllum shimeji TaxID=47721 RepID=A0A9P3PX73_LYOSH|nr:hypothetical protein LshimejAT787_1202900 [Lyophyllum shimeji]